MKRIAARALCVLLALALFAGGASGEEARFITVREWLEAKGECGSCMLLLRIREVLNPVLAVGEDETGTVNLYSGGEEEILLEFGNGERILNGFWIVIANPRYNEYEGTVEMADWTLLRLIPDLG